MPNEHESSAHRSLPHGAGEFVADQVGGMVRHASGESVATAWTIFSCRRKKAFLALLELTAATLLSQISDVIVPEIMDKDRETGRGIISQAFNDKTYD